MIRSTRSLFSYTFLVVGVFVLLNFCTQAAQALPIKLSQPYNGPLLDIKGKTDIETNQLSVKELGDLTLEIALIDEQTGKLLFEEYLRRGHARFVVFPNMDQSQRDSMDRLINSIRPDAVPVPPSALMGPPSIVAPVPGSDRTPFRGPTPPGSDRNPFTGVTPVLEHPVELDLPYQWQISRLVTQHSVQPQGSDLPVAPSQWQASRRATQHRAVRPAVSRVDRQLAHLILLGHATALQRVRKIIQDNSPEAAARLGYEMQKASHLRQELKNIIVVSLAEAKKKGAIYLARYWAAVTHLWAEAAVQMPEFVSRWNDVSSLYTALSESRLSEDEIFRQTEILRLGKVQEIHLDQNSALEALKLRDRVTAVGDLEAVVGFQMLAGGNLGDLEAPQGSAQIKQEQEIQEPKEIKREPQETTQQTEAGSSRQGQPQDPSVQPTRARKRQHAQDDPQPSKAPDDSKPRNAPDESQPSKAARTDGKPSPSSKK
jgi:hypothetical protein